MDYKKMNKMAVEMTEAIQPIVMNTTSPVDALVLLTQTLKLNIKSICHAEDLPVKENLEAAAKVLTMEEGETREEEQENHEKAIYRVLRDVTALALKPQKNATKKSTPLGNEHFWRMRDNIMDVLDGAGCNIPKEIVGVIIIGTIAQWTGKPVALESMEKETK